MPEQDRLANVLGCWNWFDIRSGWAYGEAALIPSAKEPRRSARQAVHNDGHRPQAWFKHQCPLLIEAGMPGHLWSGRAATQPFGDNSRCMHRAWHGHSQRRSFERRFLHGTSTQTIPAKADVIRSRQQRHLRYCGQIGPVPNDSSHSRNPSALPCLPR